MITKYDFNMIFVKKSLLIILILLIGHLIAILISRLAVYFSNPKKSDKKGRALVYGVIGLSVYLAIMFIIVMIVIPVFIGIELTAIITISSIFILAIGLSLQGSLGDIALGIMLILIDTIKIGDFIELPDLNLKGVISEFSILYTKIKDEDQGTIIIVPNKVLYNGIIYNPTSSEQINVLANVYISNENKDISNIINSIITNVNNYPGVYKDPPTTCNVSNITAFGTELEIRYAISYNDYKVKDTYYFQSKVMTLIRQTIIDQGGKLVNLGGVVAISK